MIPPKTLAKWIVPPLCWEAARRVLHARRADDDAIRFTGDYATWEDARRDSTGYDAPEIVARTRAAMLQVRDGKAASERDSVLLDEIVHPFPLLAGLLRAAAAEGGRLSVLDFGGSLGTTYFQCRQFLSPIRDLRWSVVEQPAHVACGRQDFANEQLRFHETIEECVSAEQPNVLLLSSVTPYLPSPYTFLAGVLRWNFRSVLVDRTPFLRRDADRLTIEHVPAWIYPATYPCWFLSRSKFLACFERRYDLLATFPAFDTLSPEDEPADYLGFIFERRAAAADA